MSGLFDKHFPSGGTAYPHIRICYAQGKLAAPCLQYLCLILLSSLLLQQILNLLSNFLLIIYLVFSTRSSKQICFDFYPLQNNLSHLDSLSTPMQGRPYDKKFNPYDWMTLDDSELRALRPHQWFMFTFSFPSKFYWNQNIFGIVSFPLKLDFLAKLNL